jgi:hypothetical protein
MFLLFVPVPVVIKIIMKVKGPTRLEFPTYLRIGRLRCATRLVLNNPYTVPQYIVVVGFCGPPDKSPDLYG